MRYLLFLCLLVLTLPVLGYNEVVSAISYNPSRLGAYTHLKAVEKATLAGGLLQPEENGGRLNVLSKGVITVQCQSGEACASNAIDDIRPVGSFGESCESLSSFCDQFQTSQKGGSLQGPNNNSGTPTGVSVVMYGGSLGKKEATSGTTAIINSISLNDSATLSVSTNTLNVPSLGVTNSLVLGDVTVSAPTVSGGTYKFITRVTDDKKKRNVLCIK